MRKIPKITLLKSGNRVVLDPTPAHLWDTLGKQLSFIAKRMLYGWEAIDLGKKIEFTPYQCFTRDHRGRLATSFGFYDRIVNFLYGCGYATVLRELGTTTDPLKLVPLWDRLYDPKWNLSLRYGQDEFLVKFMSRLAQGLPGRFDCPAGYGKSRLFGYIAALLPKASIHIASKRVPVLMERIYPELCGMLPDVGICCGARKYNRGARVMCYTFDSLGHSSGDADILLIDEIQDAASDRAAYNLARYDRSLNYGFSATHDMRLDDKDLRTEAMCGPVVFKVPYEDAAQHGLVVPIEVRWSDVLNADDNPPLTVNQPVERKRLGIWRNTYRNKIIAQNARAYQAAGLQQLITCETIEHALSLHKLLPDFELVYAVNGIKANDRVYFRQQGLLPTNHELMTQDRLHKLTKFFERGRLRSAICTTIWNVGVDMKHLDVVNRADAGGSPINDTQIPGRVSRILPDGSKTVGIVQDYRDQFDSGFRNRAGRRRNNYAKHGWTQIFPSDQHEQQSQLQLWHKE